MKILFVSLYGIENTGVRLLSSVLKKNNYDVSTIFLKNWKNNNISEPTDKETNLFIDKIKDINPNVIGISFGSPYFKIVQFLSKEIKKTLPKVFLIFGGIHATTVPEECIKFCDGVCVGEGEKAILELIDNLNAGKDYITTHNFWFNINGKIVKNELFPLIKDLNLIPFKDLSNNQKYYIDDNKIYIGDPILNIKEYRIFATRGCLFNCSYCYNSIIRNVYKKEQAHYYRIRSVDNVIDEILYAKKQFKSIRRIKFDDDTFTSNTKWIEEFCDKYKKRINIPFDIMLTPSLLNYDNLKKLKKAGLVRIQMGIEGSSKKETETSYKRTFSNDKIFEFSIRNRELKIPVEYDVIIDNPLTTDEEKEELFLFLLSLKSKFNLFIYSLNFFPKTEITKDFLNKGFITEKDIEANNNKCFKQFRASFDYKRKDKDLFYFCMLIMVSKNFIPKFIKKRIFYSEFFKKNIKITVFITKILNLFTMSFIFFKMLFAGQISMIKLKEYGNLKKLITQ